MGTRCARFLQRVQEVSYFAVKDILLNLVRGQKRMGTILISRRTEKYRSPSVDGNFYNNVTQTS